MRAWFDTLSPLCLHRRTPVVVYAFSTTLSTIYSNMLAAHTQPSHPLSIDHQNIQHHDIYTLSGLHSFSLDTALSMTPHNFLVSRYPHSYTLSILLIPFDRNQPPVSFMHCCSIHDFISIHMKLDVYSTSVLPPTHLVRAAHDRTITSST